MSCHWNYIHSCKFPKQVGKQGLKGGGADPVNCWKRGSKMAATRSGLFFSRRRFLKGSFTRLAARTAS